MPVCRSPGPARPLTSRLSRGAVVLTAALLAGCVTTRVTEPPQTATEQLLISTAVDHAVAKLDPHLPRGAKVFVDTSYFDTAPADAMLFPKYAIAALRDRLLRQGADLVDSRKKAQIVVELRSGAQSIDHDAFLIGVPSFKVPIPFASTPLELPEVALYKRDRQSGIAKLALTAYGAKTGALDASTGAKFGVSDHIRYRVLVIFSWGRNDIQPKGVTAQ